MAASIGFNAENQFTVGGTALDYGRNYIINGGFNRWDYATSQTTSGYGSDDRWYNFHFGSTKTNSMVNATDTERALFNSSKFSRTVVTSVVGTTNRVDKFQRIENVTKLAGKTVTISFWAKADSSKNIAVNLWQEFGTGGSPSATITGIGKQLIPLTSTWQKKTITVVIPSIIGKTIGTDGVHTSCTTLQFWFDAGSSYSDAVSLGQQSGTFDIAEVQLEEGSVATPWTPYEGEFGGEIQACQRYYQKFISTQVSSAYATGLSISTTSGALAMRFSEMRVAPSASSSDPAATWSILGATSSYNLTALTLATIEKDCLRIATTTTNGPAAGQAILLRATAIGAHITLSSEL